MSLGQCQPIGLDGCRDAHHESCANAPRAGFVLWAGVMPVDPMSVDAHIGVA
jgi:hypothetical protein